MRVLSQRRNIVTDGVEDPKGKHRPAKMGGEFVVAFFQERHGAGDHVHALQIAGAKSPRLKPLKDHDARLGMQQRGRQSASRGGLGCGKLIEAQHPMQWNVLAKADKVFACQVGH